MSYKDCKEPRNTRQGNIFIFLALKAVTADGLGERSLDGLGICYSLFNTSSENTICVRPNEIILNLAETELYPSFALVL